MGAKKIEEVHESLKALAEEGHSAEFVLREYFRAVLICLRGNKLKASKTLGVGLSTVKRKIDQCDWDYLKGNCGIDELIDRGVISISDYLEKKKNE